MKSKKNRESEADVFRAAMSGVAPLRPQNKLIQRPPAPEPTPRQTHLDESMVLSELLNPVEDYSELETGEELLFLRPGFPPRLLRRLRRGYFSTVDSIDLHNMIEKTAREVLIRFLSEANRYHMGCVRVVHGKGLRSKGPPVLKIMTAKVLRKHPAVIAFASCRPVAGGTGAVDILLRSALSTRR